MAGRSSLKVSPEDKTSAGVHSTLVPRPANLFIWIYKASEKNRSAIDYTAKLKQGDCFIIDEAEED